MPVIFNHFPRIAARLAVGGKAAEIATAQRIAAEARANAPQDTGALRSSIRAHGNRVTAGPVRQAFYQEFGGRGGAHPYFYRSIEHQRVPFLTRLKALLG